jgi:signal transduction histidine kinase
VHILDRAIVIDRGIDGKILTVAGTHTDISKEKQAQEKAIEAVKTKNLFLASMSHEIRTPLNGVIGVIDLIKRLPDLSDECRGYLTVVDQCSDTSLAILKDILDMCKMEAGSMKIEKHTFELRAFVERTVNLFKEKAYSQGVLLEVVWINEHEEVPETIQSDQVRIGQIISNLISK